MPYGNRPDPALPTPTPAPCRLVGHWCIAAMPRTAGDGKVIEPEGLGGRDVDHPLRCELGLECGQPVVPVDEEAGLPPRPST